MSKLDGNRVRGEACVVCDKHTTKQELNESYDMMEHVCYDSRCEQRFYRETALPRPSDLEDCNLKEGCDE